MNKKLWATAWIGKDRPDVQPTITSQISPLTRLVIVRVGPIGLAIATTDSTVTAEISR